MNRTPSAGIILIVLFFTASAQPSQSFFPAQKFLQGFVKEDSGEVLSYWNFHPFAKQSLLTRCSTGEMEIAWKTQPVPPSGARDTLSFLWIGAFATGTSTADHEFDLFVNGSKALTFQTRMGGRHENWMISGQNGVSLYYKHVWTDHVNDSHGYFCLRIPASRVSVGEPLSLKVVGHKANSRDWYMTFMYAIRESAVVRPLPMLVRENGSLRQPIEISVDSPADQGSVAIGVDDARPVSHPIGLGWNAVVVTVPAAERDREVPLSIAINSGAVMRRTASVKPVRHRTIWLLPHSHNDIGYSDVQTTVLNIQLQNLRDALRLIERSKDLPEEARFKWNVEILWPIDSFLVTAAPAERESFLRAVSNGDIGLNALYVNPLTGIVRPEALIRLTDYAQELKREYGFRIPAAMVSDIPGFSWGIVPALAQGGVRYFVSGPNSGDRIGHFTDAWGDKPFYWIGPSGTDSVMFWVAGTGYSMFHATRTIATNKAFIQKLQEYLERLDASNYPYDIVQMRYTVYSDNGMTDSTLSDFVRDWNHSHASPTLRIGTADRMCAEFERQYGAELPSYSGDITPYWEDGAASTAAEVGMAERAAERLVQAEILSSMIAPRSFDRKAFADAWDAVNLWNEHTWGAWNSVSDPDHPNAVQQWKIKQEFARESEQRSLHLLTTILSGSRSSGANLFEVINTATWPRTDLVIIAQEQSRGKDRAVDMQGKALASQRLHSGQLAVLIREVPGLGSVRFKLMAGRSSGTGDAAVRDGKLENRLFSISIDSATGSVRSIRSRADGRELVLAPDAINGLVVVSGTDPAKRSTGSVLSISAGERGPLVASIIVESEAPGIAKAVREVLLVDGSDRIDFRNSLVKQAVREKEAVYFGFPINVPGAVTRLDLGWGMIRPQLDQLPGSCKDYFSVQRWVDVSNDRQGITWSTVEAPLVSLGGLVDERHHNDGPGGWKSEAGSSSILCSWVMNNYWHTNYKADQAGTSSYQYSLRPHEGFDPVQAYRFGIERNQPLFVRLVASRTPVPALPFRLRSSYVTITSITRSPDGDGLLVRLYNPSSNTSRYDISPETQPRINVWECSPTGSKGKEARRSAEMGPYEVRLIGIE